MKRQIIFRGVNAAGKTIYGDLITEDFNDKKRYFIKLMYGSILQVMGETVQQFTGFLDRNGEMIFEGDILKTENGEAKVIWSDYSWALLSEGSEAIDYEHISVYKNSEIKKEKK